MSNILAIDDEVKLCSLYEALLKRQGHDVKSFTQCTEGLEYYQSNSDNIDAIILEECTEGAMAFVKGITETDKPKLLFVSSESDPEIKNYLGRAYSKLSKPFNPKELYVRIDNIVKKSFVLIVDDQESICSLYKSSLESDGFRVLTETESRKGFKLYQDKKDSISVIVLDLCLPDFSGIEFYTALDGESQKKVLFICGYDREYFSKQLKGQYRLLIKPFDLEVLTKEVKKVIDKE